MAENKTRRNVAKNTKELVITRIFDAPRELVWKAWKDPERMKRWWGPKNFTAPVIKIDFRHWGHAKFDRVYRLHAIPPRGTRFLEPSHYGISGDWPTEFLVTVTFEEHEGKTKMTLRHAGIPPGQMSDMAEVGWNESFGKLAQSLK